MGKNHKEPENNNCINIIGNGTNIKGDINSSSDIRIDGNLTGNVDTSGKLVIGESGKVKGEIHCKNGDISGKIEGKITTTELLSLKASSKIQGDMIVNRLAIEPGCVFIGNCQMDSEQTTYDKQGKESKPQTESKEQPRAKIL